MRALFICVFVIAPLFSNAQEAWQVKIVPQYQSVLDAVSASSLKGHLSFIASDLLEGRQTPSAGLDIAAEYIAAQFRRAGLKPGVGNSYFQEGSFSAGSGTRTKGRNVIGVLPGSDEKLKDTYLLVTAHYDHTGKGTGQGDVINNGANDNGSGTVSVIEIASAMASYKPRRTIVFIAFFGEEKGLRGSRYYGANPVFPLERTIAQINLEQFGRTDDSEGPRVAALWMTGADYSDLGSLFKDAGKATGVALDRHPTYSDVFYALSDNQALADLGVPAHTMSATFIFPDAHQPGDSWDKIDYDNMAKLVKMAALGIATLADSTREPRWTEKNPKAAKYLEAWKKRRG